MAKVKIDIKSKELVQALLQSQGIEYEDWINKQHRDFIFNNSEILVNALNKKQEQED